MPAPWEEDPHKVVVEFLKSASGAKRFIQLKHSAAVVPPQLQGRISPQVWQYFMADIEQVNQCNNLAFIVPITEALCGTCNHSSAANSRHMTE